MFGAGWMMTFVCVSQLIRWLHTQHSERLSVASGKFCMHICLSCTPPNFEPTITKQQSRVLPTVAKHVVFFQCHFRDGSTPKAP